MFVPRIPRWRCCSWIGNRRHDSPASRPRPPPWSSPPGSRNPRCPSPPDSPPPTFPWKSSFFLTVRQHTTDNARPPSQHRDNSAQVPRREQRRTVARVCTSGVLENRIAKETLSFFFLLLTKFFTSSFFRIFF